MSGSIDGNEAIYDDDTPKTDNKNIIIINADNADDITSAHKKPKLDKNTTTLIDNFKVYPVQESAEMNINPGESGQNTEELFAFDCSTHHSSLILTINADNRIGFSFEFSVSHRCYLLRS